MLKNDPYLDKEIRKAKNGKVNFNLIFDKILKNIKHYSLDISTMKNSSNENKGNDNNVGSGSSNKSVMNRVFGGAERSKSLSNRTNNSGNNNSSNNRCNNNVITSNIIKNQHYSSSKHLFDWDLQDNNTDTNSNSNTNTNNSKGNTTNKFFNPKQHNNTNNKNTYNNNTLNTFNRAFCETKSNILNNTIIGGNGNGNSNNLNDSLTKHYIQKITMKQQK